MQCDLYSALILHSPSTSRQTAPAPLELMKAVQLLSNIIAGERGENLKLVKKTLCL